MSCTTTTQRSGCNCLSNNRLIIIFGHLQTLPWTITRSQSSHDEPPYVCNEKSVFTSSGPAVWSGFSARLQCVWLGSLCSHLTDALKVNHPSTTDLSKSRFSTFSMLGNYSAPLDVVLSMFAQSRTADLRRASRLIRKSGWEVQVHIIWDGTERHGQVVVDDGHVSIIGQKEVSSCSSSSKARCLESMDSSWLMKRHPKLKSSISSPLSNLFNSTHNLSKFSQHDLRVNCNGVCSTFSRCFRRLWESIHQ